MKGKEAVYAFLEANDTKEDLPSLPSTEADRVAILTVAMELFREVKASKSTSSETTTHSELKASATPFVPNEASPEKPEEQRLCPSMWGKRECPGTDQDQCKRLHLTLCSKANCYVNEVTRKNCKQWHGHMRAVLRHEKAKERKEAEKRQFEAWKKKKTSGNGGKGHRGAPHHQIKPQEHLKQKEGQGMKNLQRQKFKPAPKPRQPKLGDFMPAPLPAVPAWGSAWRHQTALAAAAPTGQAGTSELRQQIHRVLEMLQANLQSGVF